MPRIFKPDAPAVNGRPSLPVPQLRALRALAAGGCATLAALGESGETLAALERAGHVVRDELDVDGVVERVWEATAAGRAALAGDAMAGAAVAAKGGSAAKPVRIGGLVPLFGSNRKLGHEAGRLLAGCAHLTVPFAGGLSEIPWFSASSIVACDAHGALVNLYRVAADKRLGPALYRALKRAPFAEVWLRDAQQFCREREALGALAGEEPDLKWAEVYFCAAWMARSGCAGTKGELGAGFSVRWDAGGGDSAVRYRNAAACLPAWRRMLARCTFVLGDGLEVIAKVKDKAEHGVFADPPFIGPGAAYKHNFGTGDKADPGKLWALLAAALGRLQLAKVVVRCYDHPLVRGLFSEGERWRWHRFVGKKASNKNAPEVLIENVREGD